MFTKWRSYRDYRLCDGKILGTFGWKLFHFILNSSKDIDSVCKFQVSLNRLSGGSKITHFHCISQWLIPAACTTVQTVIFTTNATFATWSNTHTHTHTHTRLTAFFRVGRYQKGKTNLDSTEARDSEWQWHQLGHMHVCTSLQTDNYASTSPLTHTHPAVQPTALKHWRHTSTGSKHAANDVWCLQMSVISHFECR